MAFSVSIVKDLSTLIEALKIYAEDTHKRGEPQILTPFLWGLHIVQMR